MKLNIKVIPNAKKNEIRHREDMTVVKIKAPAVEGKANKELIKYLVQYYKVKANNIKILKGERSRHKVVLIEKND
ncbi:MAG: YggU family protein [Spirochaetes bacterium]|nr:YggU family protein [Spirochaetota bacterium]